MADSEQRIDGGGIFSDEGKRLALVVGVNRSIESEYRAPLEYAEHDAYDMARALEAPACKFMLFKPALLGEQATSSKVKSAITDLISVSTDQPFVCFYFSGHAQPRKVKGERLEIYLVTHDFK